jgi:uncharacterized membrane protein
MHAALKLLLLLIVFILAAALDGLLVYGVKTVSGPQQLTERAAVEAVLPQAARTAPREAATNQTEPPVTPPRADGNPSPDGKASAPAAARENPPEQAPTPSAPKEPTAKVIGNSDSKRYHLPGMAYYDQVDAYHRIEFRSEEEAIKTGYRKAPR